jgi:hypothetical protein
VDASVRGLEGSVNSKEVSVADETVHLRAEDSRLRHPRHIPRRCFISPTMMKSGGVVAGVPPPA